MKLPGLSMLFFLLILSGAFLDCYAAQGTDSLLDKRVNYASLEKDIQDLAGRGYVSDGDQALLSMAIVDFVQRGIEPDSMTYGQLLDSLAAIKQNMVAAVAKENSFGTDSVFVRNPNGVKVFLGLGTMTFEELVAQESRNLPEHYPEHAGYEMPVGKTDQASEILSGIMVHSNISWIIGNVLMVENEQQALDGLRIGDLLEIATRISTAEAFLPFMKDN
jgi:hypothetical protein